MSEVSSIYCMAGDKKNIQKLDSNFANDTVGTVKLGCTTAFSYCSASLIMF